jgi:hypothetical protein
VAIESPKLNEVGSIPTPHANITESSSDRPESSVWNRVAVGSNPTSQTKCGCRITVNTTDFQSVNQSSTLCVRSNIGEVMGKKRIKKILKKVLGTGMARRAAEKLQKNTKDKKKAIKKATRRK